MQKISPFSPDFSPRIPDFSPFIPDFSPREFRLHSSVLDCSVVCSQLRLLKIMIIGDRRRRSTRKATKLHLKNGGKCCFSARLSSKFVKKMLMLLLLIQINETKTIKDRNDQHPSRLASTGKYMYPCKKNLHFHRIFLHACFDYARAFSTVLWSGRNYGS